MSVDQICENIIRQLNRSRLDYQMNQTPYSMQFFIQKKFVKGHNPSLQFSSDILKDIEIFQVQQEYQKLYHHCQIASRNEENLKSEFSSMKTNFHESTEALGDELISTKEILSEKENTIANLMLKCDENCVENKKNEKKENKSVKKQSKPSILEKKNKPLDETITRMKIDKDKETKLEEANQNDYKVDSNVPVSNRFSILDRD